MIVGRGGRRPAPGRLPPPPPVRSAAAEASGRRKWRPPGWAEPPGRPLASIGRRRESGRSRWTEEATAPSGGHMVTLQSAD